MYSDAMIDKLLFLVVLVAIVSPVVNPGLLVGLGIAFALLYGLKVTMERREQNGSASQH